jgi:hypothetical protein
LQLLVDLPVAAMVESGFQSHSRESPEATDLLQRHGENARETVVLSAEHHRWPYLPQSHFRAQTTVRDLQFIAAAEGRFLHKERICALGA